MKHVLCTRTVVALVFWLALSCFVSPRSALAQPTQTLADIIGDTPQFSILEESLERTGVNVTLAPGGPYTVFALTNAAFRRAFDKLGVSSIDDVVPEQLTGLLLYHLVDGKILAEDLVAEQTVATL